MGSERVEIDVDRIRTTQKAMLVMDADDKEFWLPLSQIEILEANLHNEQIKLSIPEWLAIEKGQA